jgi:hypothetical protein
MITEVSTERRRLLLAEAIAGMNARDLDAYGRMFAEDVSYTPGSTEPPGTGGTLQWVDGLSPRSPIAKAVGFHGARVRRFTFGRTPGRWPERTAP